MPILPAQPDIYPPNLLEFDNGCDLRTSTRGHQRRWMCLHTKPRQEKATVRDLQVAQIPHYLPQITQISRTPAGRKIRSVLPLFTSYVFLFGDEEERVAALKSNRLVKILEVPDQDQLADDLRQIQTMLSSGLPVSPEPTYPVGTAVRIINGPLRGLVGKVIRRDKRDQFVAVVNMLGCGAAVDLEDWQVERVEE
jgi:transcriptional antiterminator RfaH